jgi:tRNA(adenine34) deaminase
VLVDQDGNVVNWAVNCVDVLNSGTQHGEVRLMLGYQIKNKAFGLEGFTVYTTLEPCAQCSGMMTLQSVARTVFCQRDPDFGNAIQRLEFDGSKVGGFKPYPRAVVSVESPAPYARQLDQLYLPNQKKFKGIVDFLFSDEAKAVYAKCTADLLAYKPRFPANAPKLQAALTFFQQVPTKFVPIGITL